MAKVLILDQSKSVRNTLCERLNFEGFETIGEAEISKAERLCGTKQFDILLCDNRFVELPEHLAHLPFVVLSPELSVDMALDAARRGALDCLGAPIDMNRLLTLIRGIDKHESEPLNVRRTTRRRAKLERMVGSSHQICRLREIISKVAPSPARVLIMGENGTGKELVARELHRQSQRAGEPFVEINCAAIPSELIESELFGHEKGAFTSAVKLRRGKFEQASGGTLFMDEVGDMSLSAQAKVLRALQERKITRVGSDRDIDVDVRVIAATNKNLRCEIDHGNFREDLYHRLGVIILSVCPLRERSEDIPLLVDHFLKQICQDYEIDCKEITREALTLLTSMPWRGNIRELHNVVERLVILCGDRIEREDIASYCDIS
ncbi:MAG: sigma-54 dependent transcriptional regulator [Rikenellaceae bacterium]